MDHPRRSSPAHIPWGPYGQLGWVVVTCACDPLPSRRPRTLKRARTGGSGRRLSGSLAGDSGDHHQYQRRGIVSCDVCEDSQALQCGVQGVQRGKVGKNQKSSASSVKHVLIIINLIIYNNLIETVEGVQFSRDSKNEPFLKISNIYL